MRWWVGVAAGSALLAACSAPPPPPRPDADFAAFAALDANAFPGAAKVLTGFAPMDDDLMLRVGDAALFGIEMRRSGRSERRLLLLEAQQVPLARRDRDGLVGYVKAVSSFMVTITPEHGEPEQHKYKLGRVQMGMRQFDADGVEQHRSEATLYEEPLQAGLWPGAVAAASQSDDDLAFLLMMSLQNLAGSDATLKDLMFQVVDAPGVLSVLSHLGVNVNVRWQREDCRTCDLPGLPMRQQVRVLPIDLSINGALGLWVDLLVINPTGPTVVCGGILGAIARHPTEPGRMAAVRLLATRRAAK